MFLIEWMNDLVCRSNGTDTNISLGRGLASYERRRADWIPKELTEIDMWPNECQNPFSVALTTRLQSIPHYGVPPLWIRPPVFRSGEEEGHAIPSALPPEPLYLPRWQTSPVSCIEYWVSAWRDSPHTALLDWLKSKALRLLSSAAPPGTTTQSFSVVLTLLLSCFIPFSLSMAQRLGSLT